jgi:endoglucanase
MLVAVLLGFEGTGLLPAAEPLDAFAVNRLLSPGINLGNALEAPREGEWGMTLKEEYFAAIAQAGFKGVRIPIRWSTHAAAQPPYTIDPPFFERIDWAIEQAVSRKLAVVINVHHYGEMDTEPDKHLPRLKGLWKQIAERYRKQSEQVVFEILNEPHDKLTDELWQESFPQLLAIIRESNPNRFVIVGPGHWNNIDHLDKLSLPEIDQRLIATVHYYSPFEFTHQGAQWVPESARWKGRKWTGSDGELAALRRDLQKAADWGRRNNRPIYLGEFGAYQAADMSSRAAWTAAVSREAEKLGMAWCYWEFGSGFGAYDRETNQWREPLLEALLKRR